MHYKFIILIQETTSWLLYKEKIIPSGETIKIACMSLKNEDLENSKLLLSDIFMQAGNILFSYENNNTTAEEDKKMFDNKPKIFPKLEFSSTLLVTNE